MAKFKKGHKGYWKGKKFSIKHRKRMSIGHKGITEKDKHWAWKGGKLPAGNGYIKVWQRGHANAKKDGYILEHRLVMSNYLGRPLKKGEFIHHRNGNRKDNRIENLQLVTGVNHKGEVICPFCQKEFFVR